MTNTSEKIMDGYSGEILIKYSDRLVQITCSPALKRYLEKPGNGALALSTYILDEYKKRRKSELKISKDSLAIEILAHTYTDTFSEVISSAGNRLPSILSNAVLGLMKQIQTHTEIIDCGESDVDSNRWIWDRLTVLKKIIYAALGDRA